MAICAWNIGPDGAGAVVWHLLTFERRLGTAWARRARRARLLPRAGCRLWASRAHRRYYLRLENVAVVLCLFRFVGRLLSSAAPPFTFPAAPVVSPAPLLFVTPPVAPPVAVVLVVMLRRPTVLVAARSPVPVVMLRCPTVLVAARPPVPVVMLRCPTVLVAARPPVLVVMLRCPTVAVAACPVVMPPRVNVV